MRLAAVLLPIALLGSALPTPPVRAAERVARLTVDVTVQGSQSRRGPGTDHAERSIRQSVHFVTELKSSGVLSGVNTQSPTYAREALAKAQGDAAHQQRVRAAAEDGRRAAAACGADQACLLRVAVGLSGRVAPEPAPGAGFAEAPEGRFLSFTGFAQCRSTLEVRIDDHEEGAYGDVQGMVPYRVHTEADYRATPEETRYLCSTLHVTEDVKSGVVSGLRLPAFVTRGTVTRTERGRTERVAEKPGLQRDAFAWAIRQMQQARKSGSARGTVPVTPHGGGKQTGTVVVEVKWTFES